jgi:hypothetical protein
MPAMPIQPAMPMPMPAGYSYGMPAAPPTMMVPASATTAAPAADPVEGANLPQLLAMLRDSLYPSQREWVAERLTHAEFRGQPQVMDALLTAAHDDPAPMVRAGCVRSLVRLKVNSVPVINVVRGLQADPDPRVRQEADQALAVLLEVRPASANR